MRVNGGDENARTRPNEPLMDPRAILLVISVLPIVSLTSSTAVVGMETPSAPFEPAHMARFRALRATSEHQTGVLINKEECLPHHFGRSECARWQCRVSLTCGAHPPCL